MYLTTLYNKLMEMEQSAQQKFLFDCKQGNTDKDV